MTVIHSAMFRVLAAGLILMAFVLIPFILFGGAMDRRTEDLISPDHGLAALMGAVLLALDVVLPVPSSVVTTAMGALLGGAMGTLVNVVGLTAGCLLGLLLGRAGTPVAKRILGARIYADFDSWVDRHGLVALVLCRAVPVLAEASVIALGTARGRRLPLVCAAVLADIGLGAVYAFAGAASGPKAVPSAPALSAAIGLPALALLVTLAWIRRNPRISG